MIVNFVVHTSEGRISRTGSCPEEMVEIQAHGGETAIHATGEGLVDYVVQGAITKRPPNPATLEGNTLSNLPTPCTIRVNATEYACTDESATLSLTYSGTYKIVVSAWPHLDVTFTIVKP